MTPDQHADVHAHLSFQNPRHDSLRGKHLVDLRLRDRDTIVTKEGILFRVYGYSHPAKAYICDPEYATANIYRSEDPRSLRTSGSKAFYKFYADEGLRFVRQNYPRHTVWHEQLCQRLVAVQQDNIEAARRPDKTLQALLQRNRADLLLQALKSLLDLVLQGSGLSDGDFGVFGSLLNNFHHPDFSDLDFIIYGSEKSKCLRATLEALYQEVTSPLRNEFEDLDSVKNKVWKFSHYTPEEYVWHQKRKQIYGLYHHQKSGRTIKAEFEPVRQWDEIRNEYNQAARIERKGWVKLLARVKDDREAGFMPSIYQIEPIKVLKGETTDCPQRVVSFVEEFRLQAQRDELAIVEGNLEQVLGPKEFRQVTLTYGPGYYEQTLKVAT